MNQKDGRTYEELPYNFNQEEISRLGMQLAHLTKNLLDMRDRKAAAMAAFAAEQKELTSQMVSITDCINLGHEMREYEVMVRMDDPRPGYKTIFRVVDNYVIRTEPMTPAERQGSFGFDPTLPDDRPER